MWKIVLGFVVFAGIALYLLSKGGDIDLGGEKHGGSQSGAWAAFMLTTGDIYIQKSWAAKDLKICFFCVVMQMKIKKVVL